MCKYCKKVSSIIGGNPNGYSINRCNLFLNLNGDIRFTKHNKKTGNSYSKVIPLVSLHQAKNISFIQGMSAVNRTWHNNLPEGKSRPCNLIVIKAILNTIPK